MINDNVVETYAYVSYSAYQDTALQETSWTETYRLGFLVKCAVRLRATLDSGPGSYTYSEPFYAGIQTDSSEYTVTETGTIEVTAWLTVPLGCSYLASSTPDEINSMEENQCNLHLKVRTPDYYANGQLTCTPGGVTDEPISFETTKLCGLTFLFLEQNVTKTFTIFGSGDKLANLNARSIFIRMTTDIQFTHHAWSSASSPDIHVVVTDQDIDLEDKFCAVRTDPNMWTFDKGYWFYQQSGEHVLYKHDILPIRVHTVFDSCVWGGACVYGVAVRNGDALFVVNLCRSTVGTPWTSSTTNTNHYIEQRACDNTHMTVETKGSDFYMVTLSSGTVVTISIRIDSNSQYTYVRYVQVKPSLIDWGASEGLCGVLDGNIANDMQKRDGSIATSWSEFGIDWRLDPAADGNSLFDVGVPLSDFPIPPLQYCRCRANATNWARLSDQVICDLDSTITSCARVTDTSSYFTQCDKAPVKRKKDTYSSTHGEPTKFGVVLDENYVTIPEVYAWRNGWSETLAEEACRLAFNGDSLLTKCKDIVPKMSENIETSEEECVNDILVSANTNFMKDTVEALKTTCIVEAMRSENLTTKGSGSEPGMTFLDELLELSCPNNCSGNGNCINGTCACSSGLYGDECSLQKTTPPVVRQAGTNGLCKTDVSTCRSFVIPGLNFIDSQLTCKVRYIKVYSDRWESQSATENFPAIYLNSINCVCIIPVIERKKRSVQSETIFAEGFLLSVSNDGVSFSNETTFITYDSTCYECNSTSVSCTELSSCSNSKTMDYNDKDNVDTKDVLSQVLIGVGIFIVIALSVAIVIICFKKKQQRAQIADSSTNVRQGPERVRYSTNHYVDQRCGTPDTVNTKEIILKDVWFDDKLPENPFN
ncbi:uncharacterized protein LOC110464752 [Mizuhopecten yessoensis]|uniref:von Willebrand factor D and EGF domain-containing protein n=1 Tax=Mizuhopecten yessoensis TaxID=6573 RepID=A0A210PT85_MIZYE|nr:uncharacterized protein LOC110464752 [Mizuhopecten yessoensis]OWF39666.1 von Willebrand factor D and EGF domain-containing protein [Mizuhopecten yessoensis]